MPSPTLLTSGVVSIVAGVSFLFVARAVSQRDATGPRLLARRAHMTWWGGLALYLLTQGALTLAAAADALSAGVYVGSRVVMIPVLCAATWGIAFYLTYLYTGDARAARPLAAFYALVALVFFYATYSVPQSLTVERWIITLDDSSTLYKLVYALVGLPPIVASVAYLLLLRRVKGLEQRYRILLAASAILLYVASGLAARLSANDAIIFATLVPLGFLAAGISLAAYYPPRFMKRRLHWGEAS